MVLEFVDRTLHQSHENLCTPRKPSTMYLNKFYFVREKELKRNRYVNNPNVTFKLGMKNSTAVLYLHYIETELTSELYKNVKNIEFLLQVDDFYFHSLYG